MGEVLCHGPKDYALPIFQEKVDESDEYPDPPKFPIEPIHALQLIYLPFLMVYLFFSLIIAISANNFLLLLISLISILSLIGGRILEKQFRTDLIKRRKIAISVMLIEVGLFFTWQISCNYNFR